MISYAEQCSVKGNENFDITVNLSDYNPAQTYTIYYQKQGNKDPVLIWSNQSSVNGVSPVVYESSFVQGSDYQIKFFYDSSARTITYYYKLASDAYWSEGDTRPIQLDNGQSLFIEDGADSINCEGGSDVVPPEPDPEPEPDIDWCNYFPEPAQSWVTQGTTDYSSFPASNLGFHNASSSRGDGGQSIIGWSGQYIETNTIKDFPDTSYVNGGQPYDALLTGFDTSSEPFQTHQMAACDLGGGCITGSDGYDIKSLKVPPPPLLNINFPADGSADISFSPTYGSATAGYNACNSSSLCSVEITRQTNGRNLVIMTIEQDLSSLVIDNNQGTEDYKVVISGTRAIKNLTANTNNYGELSLEANTVLNVDRLELAQQAGLTLGAKVRINIGTSFMLDNASVKINYPDSRDTLFYGPTATFNTHTSSGGNFWGYFVVKNMLINNPMKIVGAVAANNIDMATNGIQIISGNFCAPTPPPDATYTLDVTPDNQFALLCQAPEVTFTVYNDDGSVATDYDGTITATFPDGLTPSTPIVGTQNSEYVYTPNQGEVVVPVKSATLQEYTVNAELTDDSDAKDSGNLLFGPYQFAADPVKAVAGHPTQFDVQVLACKNDQVTPVQGYSGDKKLTITDITLTKPTINQGALDGGLEVSATQSGSYSNSDVTLSFSDDAKSQAYLRYNESGSLNFTLTDPEFVCPTEYDGCEVTNDDGTSENITSLQGIVNVDVRPWTFAICNPTNQDMSGDSDGGTGFIAAGEKFNLEVKPIVWQNGGSLSADIDVSNYCNANVTQNFLLSNAQAATVLMGSNLATPPQGRLGSGVQADEGDGLTREHDAVLNSGDDHYTYAGLTWQEVGSLNITADSADNYLDMNINQGYREIGRFYPHHFKLENDNVWDYAAGHSGFAYMNQPIAMDYRVKAKSAADSDTENYGYFADKLKASLMVEAIEKSVVFGTTVEGDSLSERFIVGDNQSLNNWDKATYEFNSNDFMFLKDHFTNSPYTTTPDGPYDGDNSVFGVAVDPSNSTFSNDDNVNFDQDFVDTSTFKATNGLDELGVAFFTQPDFRYGRMVLDAVSSPIGGPVSVPLRVEYWDKTSFVVNSDDNGSRFKADVYYVMSNINGSSAKLSGSNASSFNTVSSGKSSLLQAKQDSAERETVRLFLRQGNSASGYGNNPEPVADDELNATVAGWKNAENIEQPWLQFNWRDKGDEDPSTVVTFGAYRGNDRVIFRGEKYLTDN